jgi:hypothetical protein
MEHCKSYDHENEGCRNCPGIMEIKRADGTVDRECQAGRWLLKQLLLKEEERKKEHGAV